MTFDEPEKEETKAEAKAKAKKIREAAYDVAVGRVTVSTPMFTPLEAYSKGDRALKFGALRDEDALSRRVSRANVSIANVDITLRELLGALAFAGERSSSSETTKSSSETSQTTENGEQTTTFSSPELPSPASPLVDDAVRKAALALLAPSGQNFDFTADEMATLVASLKMYMVNLEDYYNASYLHTQITSGLVGADGWVPYRVNFTVSAEPGWHTRSATYDAVAEVTFGTKCPVKVVTAVPPQATQALQQFGARFNQLATTIQAEGSYNRIAARAAVKSLKAAAERLEGLRSNTTFIASYPADNTLRMRFRPSAVPTTPSADLQPVSRIITAIVLVNPNGDDCKIRSTKSENTRTNYSNQSSQRVVPENPAAPRNDAIQPNCREWKPLESKPKEPANSETLKYTTKSWFEFNGSTFSRLGKRRNRQRPFQKKYHRLETHGGPDSSREAIIPAWGNIADLQPPRITSAEGYYVKKSSGSYHGVVKFHIDLPDHVSPDCDPGDDSYIEIQAPGVEAWKCDDIRYSQDVLCTFDSQKIEDSDWKSQAINAYVSVKTNDHRLRVVSTKVALSSAFASSGGARTSGASSGPTIGISSGNVELKSIPLKDVPLDVLKLLVGERVTLSVVEAKPAKTSSSAATKRSK